MRLLRQTGAATLVALALAAGMAAAQETGAVLRSPIVTLERERLFTESRAGQALLERLEADSAALAAENRRIEAELTAEERDLTERRAELPADEFRSLAEAFDEKVVRIRREQDAKARALSQRRETDQQEFFREVLPLLAELVRERGAVAVLERGAVFLSAEQIDITDEAIALIDARLSTGAAQPNEAPPESGGGAE
ncbi:periplasmic chaperone for outer membrane proteins Skp [Rhodovulum sp. ES.010]|uniref:OmpH family outer membrane protein n=1 Tax=Rhodovulum sp. ES.010 TaxID=1882821 RepID=UPI00092C3FBB|nr:OmpH family outer membrane protein [Rhodovulum sp. ES.010]SIO18727.1 periplasmic chaperone for outer membrane proteins Skp [Rhodovulum sp. ES.010]